MSLRRFVIWRPENGQDEDDGKTVCAYNAEEAVERWADQCRAKEQEVKE